MGKRRREDKEEKWRRDMLIRAEEKKLSKRIKWDNVRIIDMSEEKMKCIREDNM